MKKIISGTMDLVKRGDSEPYVRNCKYTVIVCEDFDDLDTQSLIDIIKVEYNLSHFSNVFPFVDRVIDF